MAIYPTKSAKFNMKKNKFKVGLTLTITFSFVLMLLLFNFLPIITITLLGTFGLLIYPLSIFLIALGILMMCNKTIIASRTLVFYSILWIMSLVLIIHLITSVKIIDSGFNSYLSYTFKNTITVGGIIFSLLVYPIYYISHIVACFVILSIIFIIASALLIEKIYTEKKLKHGNSSNQNSVELSQKNEFEYDNFDDDIIENDSFNDKTINNQLESNDDSSIFIKDDDEDDKDLSSSNLFTNNFDQKKNINYAEILERQIDNNVYKQKDVKEEINQKSNKPNIFVHEDEDEFNLYSKKESLSKPVPKVDPNEEKKKAALEYLNISRGKFEAKTTSSNNIDNVKPMEPHTINNDQANLRKQTENNISRLNSLSDKINILNNKKDMPVGVNPFKDINNNPSNNNLNKGYNDKPQNIEQTKLPEMTRNTYTNEVKEGIVDAEGFRPVQITINEPINKPKPQQKIYKKPPQYKRPPIDLLRKYASNSDNDIDTMKEKGELIVETLRAFKIETKIINAVKGPTFTRYELQMAPGVSVNLVKNKIDDLQMVLEGNCRVQVPIPGKNAFGIEVPNQKRVTVGLREILESSNFQNSKSPLTFALGKDISGECKVACVDKLVHTLVAGSTGSGKSVCLNTLLVSLLYKASPEDLRLLLVDPKSVEFTMFNDLPHMLIPKTITDCEKAVDALSWLVAEMDRRYKKLSQLGVKKLSEYNETPEVLSGQVPKMYYIVMIFDEVGDFMTRAKKEIEEKIMLLAAKSRACGIHLILATQRPTVDVITGTIKANLPTRISFAVKSSIDSKTILDGTGAEYLLGMGDMLYLPQGSNDMDRIQGCFLDNNELKSVINYIKENNECDYDEEIEDQMFNKNEGFDPTNGAEEVFDPLLKDCLRFFIKSKKASASSLQAAFGIGYPKANKIVMQMEKAGFVSAGDHNGRRTLFVTQQEFEERFGEDL